MTTRWAREHAAAQVARELVLVELLADWQEASQALRRAYAGMYALGLCRTEIAERLSLPLDRVPALLGDPDPLQSASPDPSDLPHEELQPPEHCEPLLEDDHTF